MIISLLLDAIIIYFKDTLRAYCKSILFSVFSINLQPTFHEERMCAMPLIRMETSIKIPEEKKPDLISALSKITAEATGKPETYVMAILSEAAMSMAGTTGPAAFLDVRSIGSINKKVNSRICQEVVALLDKSLGIPGERVYISFTDVKGANWGCNGTTFG
jgi:phenylpyruvate tautomerase PptA (4-oxalocrotonate tautomerase family)